MPDGDDTTATEQGGAATAPRSARASVFATLAFFFFLSGAAGLAYEVVWTRMLILVFGSTTFAVSTVLTAFMGGLALGGWLAGRYARRFRNPARVYGIMEIGIGLYALGVPLFFDALVPLFREAWALFHPSFYAFSLIRFLLCGSVIVLPTVLMGATLPVLSAFLARRRGRRGFRVGLLYAVNTGGAVAGALLAGFVLLPAVGVSASLWAAAATNLLLGAAVILLSFRVRTPAPEVAPQGPYPAPLAPGTPAPEGLEAGPKPALPRPPGFRLVLWLIFLSGFVAMTYEVAWSRILHLMIGSSVYAFTVILVTFLTGLAGGAAVVTPFLRRLKEGRGLAAFGAVQAGVAVAVFFTLTYFSEIPYLYASFAQAHVVASKTNLSYANLTFLQFLISGLVMLAPAGLLGAAFPLAVQIRAGRGEETGRLVGRVYSINTMGSILGSFAGGFLLLPALGIQNTLLIGLAANALMGAAALWHAGRKAETESASTLRLAMASVAVGFGVFALLAAPRWNRLLMSRGLYKYALDPNLEDGSRKAVKKRFLSSRDLLFYREGITTTVCVVDQGKGHRYMATNGKVDASSKMDMPTQVLLAQIPMAVAPANQDVMVVGFASGTTVGSALLHPLQSLTAVEIEPAILEASRYFDDWNNRPLEDPRLRVIHEDARNHLLVTDRTFDLVISEPSNPWMTVAANLFTKDYYEIARARLKPGGCYCQWLQLYALRAKDVKCLVRTFLSVFPTTYVFYSKESVDLMLIGSSEPFTIDARRASGRVRLQAVASDLDRVGVDSLETLLSHFMEGPEELEAFAGEGPLNTDDNARIEFSTPRTMHLNIGDRIQAEMLEHVRGLSPYLEHFGRTPARRALFLRDVAIASAPIGEGVEALTAAFARDALAMDPGNPAVEAVARALMEQ